MALLHARSLKDAVAAGRVQTRPFGLRSLNCSRPAYRRGRGSPAGRAPPPRCIVTTTSEVQVRAAESSEPRSTLQLQAQVIKSIDEVAQEEWDAVACGGDEVNPFLKWSFLHILEASKSVVPEEGWAPRHVLVRDEGGTLVGCCPLYLKGHSYGEYVFDNSWASYSSMMGVRYYPKLQSCVPFTPVTGPRLLVAPGPMGPAIRRAMGETLQAVAESLGVSSLHITFGTAEEWAQLGAQGFQQRRGIQYHWENNGYATFDDFLADLKQSKRKSIRQERKSIAGQGLTVKRLTGADITTQHWDMFYSFYLNTVDKKWGSAYLTREFFYMLGREMAEDVLLVVAEEEGGRVVAAALNFIGSHALYGRNWGCGADRQYKNLHFELCYYQAIEEAIVRGLPRVEAGAQGEHKMQRGYLPALTFSSHWIKHPGVQDAVQRFLDREAEQVAYTWQALTLQASPFKKERTLEYVVDKMNSYSSLSSVEVEEELLLGDQHKQGADQEEDGASGGSSGSESGASTADAGTNN